MYSNYLLGPIFRAHAYRPANQGTAKLAEIPPAGGDLGAHFCPLWNLQFLLKFYPDHPLAKLPSPPSLPRQTFHLFLEYLQGLCYPLNLDKSVLYPPRLPRDIAAMW